MTGSGCFNGGRRTGRGCSPAGLRRAVTLLLMLMLMLMQMQMLMLPGVLALDKGGESRPMEKGAGDKTESAMEGTKRSAESLEKEKFVYLIQNDQKNQVTKVKWREDLTLGRLYFNLRTYEPRLVIEVWRGEERTTYNVRRVRHVFDLHLADRDVMIIGPMTVARRATIEALPEIKALNLPRDKRKHRDLKF